MIRRLILSSCLLLAGCSSVSGPFAPRTPQRVDDPLLSIGEQERRGRDRLALPDESKAIAPTDGGLNRPNTPGFSTR
jgi:hypothetical protein